MAVEGFFADPLKSKCCELCQRLEPNHKELLWLLDSINDCQDAEIGLVGHAHNAQWPGPCARDWTVRVTATHACPVHTGLKLQVH